MYAWALLTEVNCYSGTGEKNTILFYYIHAKVHTHNYLHMAAKFCLFVMYNDVC